MSLFRVKKVAEGRFVIVHVSDVGEDQDCDDQYEAGQNPVGQKQDTEGRAGAEFELG